MKKVKPVVARNSQELANVSGLSPGGEIEIEVRSNLNDKIIEVVAKNGLTHADVARLAQNFTHSRHRYPEPQYTRHLNRPHVTCAGSLGVRVKLQYKNAA